MESNEFKKYIFIRYTIYNIIMSIATLKRKTQARYNNMSVGSKDGFSLNGTHRNQGYIGQSSLSRSLPRTLMKGDTPRGHGGCCGTYNITPIVQSAVISTNDPNVVKSSVLGTSGMLATKYRWIRRPAPYATVKQDNNRNLNNQGDYLLFTKRRHIRCVNDATGDVKPVAPQSQCTNPFLPDYSTQANFSECSTCILAPTTAKSRHLNCKYNPTVNHIVKPAQDFVAKTQGEYLALLENNCTATLDEFAFTLSSGTTNRLPFTC